MKEIKSEDYRIKQTKIRSVVREEDDIWCAARLKIGRKEIDVNKTDLKFPDPHLFSE
jgi:hypothetical protein